MKVLYIQSKLKNPEYRLSNEDISKLPRKLLVVYSIQYKDLALSIKKQLEDSNIKIVNFQQVLGCSKINTRYPVLFIGTGKFHAINLFLQAPAIFILEQSKIIQIPSSEIESFKNKKKSSLIKFLKAEKIGILTSTKPGQESLFIALKLKNQLARKSKKSYLFLTNNIDTAQFENFDIDSWVNTACPGISLDSSKVINYKEIVI